MEKCTFGHSAFTSLQSFMTAKIHFIHFHSSLLLLLFIQAHFVFPRRVLRPRLVHNHNMLTTNPVATHRSSSITYLIGDIGGTNARFQFYLLKDGIEQDQLIAEKIYPSQQYATLTDVIRTFLEMVRSLNGPSDGQSRALPHPTSCCLAVAGPVIGGRCRLTNVNWEISEQQLSSNLGIPLVSLINDFVAAGYGVLAPSTELHTIYAPRNSTNEPSTSIIHTKESRASVKLDEVQSSVDKTLHPKAIIGAGTGLGEAYAVPTQSHSTSNTSNLDYTVFPTEGGHTTFAPMNDLESMVANHIKKTLSLTHVSVERIASGSGIPYIYGALAHHYPERVTPSCHTAIQSANTSEKAAVISKFAKSQTCGLCVQTIQLFVDAYGSETGNLALKILPYGGIYIAGGIATKLLWAMQDNDRFVNAFLSKGRMRNIVERMPIYVATSKREIGLIGTQVVARRMLQPHHEGRVKSALHKLKSKL